MSKSEAKREAEAYQLHLGEKLPETVYRFDQGTVIYPLNSSRGTLRNSVTARERNMKRSGLKVYESLSRIDLFFDNRYRSMPEGTLFGAYQKKRHKVKIT